MTASRSAELVLRIPALDPYNGHQLRSHRLNNLCASNRAIPFDGSTLDGTADEMVGRYPIA